MWDCEKCREGNQQRRGVGNTRIMASVFREGITEMTYLKRCEGGKGAIQEAMWEKTVSNRGKVNANVLRQVCA